MASEKVACHHTGCVSCLRLQLQGKDLESSVQPEQTEGTEKVEETAETVSLSHDWAQG